VVSIEGARPVTGAAAGNRRPAGQAASTANRELCRDMRPARQRHHDGDLAMLGHGNAPEHGAASP
jgi:hypothetical protein